MTTQKDHLKAMINATIEKDDAKATSEFHAYLATKMQGAMQKVDTSIDTTSQDDNS